MLRSIKPGPCFLWCSDGPVPHVIVKLWSGKSETQKRELTDAIVSATRRVLGYSEDAVSVAFEEVPPGAWTACSPRLRHLRTASSLMP
ncbi:tautomerase family protein [Sphingobium sp. EM0848]|uniref:tautomerase family protein n=1 Tax=Sphingobium sp. EM0848 TaxID=2743473 RepID=UPI0021017EFD|nr:tautomerase family protein [Sphingobium sp. EM0848]